MKKLLFISLTLLLFSCSPRSTEDKESELENYKNLVEEYTEKVRILEQEIGSSLENQTSPADATVVRVKNIAPSQLTSYFSATGTVEALQDAFISPEVNGQISAILINRGDEVKKGDLLVRLNTDLTMRNIDEVKTSLKLAEKLFQKQEQLWKKEIGSEVQYLEAMNGMESLKARLATLQSQLDRSYIRAPFDGIVDDIMVKTGELASPGMRMIRLINLDEMRITAQVSESFLGNIASGDMVKLSFSSYPEMKLEQPVTRIGTVIDPVTRTFAVEVLVKNADYRLKPNMISSIRISDYADADALLVPSIILKDDFNGTFLFRAIKEGSSWIAEKTYVETGKTVQDITKITKGISEGDKVIVEGYNMVTDSEPITILN
ncbi:MAG: efflux RND transporter periplasmic adaptor subunit [Bacteroidales bacterium]|nr:efflux RND transporter periplasmic adaptor subunit [Bacteroidales bacterium]